MNAPVLLAQLAGSTTQTPSPKNLKLEKPQNGQAVSVHLDGNTKLDFADIASEKLTFVKVGEKLIILFDNQSTVTIDPVFDSMGKPLSDLAFDMGSDRTLTGDQFAQTFPITTDQSVLPAAGGATGPTGGANFGEASVNALGASGARLALLGGEDGGGTFDTLDDGTPNPSPIPGGVTAVTLNEDGFAEGNPGGTGDSGGTATSVTGSLNVDFGTDFVNRSFAFSLNQPTLAGLTSDGQAVQLAFTTVNGQPVLIGYVGSDFSVAANQVFTVSLDASSLQGSYTFTLLRPLDHPIHGTEDTINLSINVIATDGSGDTAPVTISIGINDDTPVIGTPADAALTDPLSGNPATQTGSLGISWGADRYNDHVDGGVSATTGATGDRSVVFANSQVTATGDGTTAIGTLTSHGETVHYVLLENGTVLVAYTGETAPTSLASLQQSGEGEGEGGIASNIVFTVTLSDASNSGSYVVTQYRSLDHDQGTTTFQNIDLAFNFTATDSDGDSVNGTLHAVIADTVPVVTGPAEEGQLSEASGKPQDDGGEDMPSLLVVGGSFTPKDTGEVSLHIDWRSDNQNPTAAGGAHDRSVTFTAATQTALEALGLTADGATIRYEISADGTSLTAFVGSSEGEGTTRTIFTVQLSDSGDGSYRFILLDNLDHLGNSGSSQALTFGFIATDSDSDSTAPATFTVNIADDVPTAGEIGTETLVEQTQSGQTNNFISSSLENISLNINWGADDVNNDGASIDRKVAFTTASAPSGLTSNGEAITYTLSENGTLLTASAGERVIFTVKLSDIDSGSYTFVLKDNLDHVGEGNGASLALGFNFTATDADGDPVNSSFTINVTDDVPSTGEIAGQNLVESTSTESSNAFIAKTLSAISLNVDWNSDDANAGGTNDRSVAFTTSSAPSGLTSNGVSIVYTLSENGTLLTATAGARTVFTVKLSDTDNGTYTFNLLDNLDHTGANGTNLPLTFSFTATDSDGDTTSPASFTVTVTDDTPSIGTPETLTVIESTSASSSNAFISATATGSLAVDWNSDDNNQVSGPGASDRSVAFTAATLTSLNALHLTSNGTALTYSLSDNGQLLTAKAGGTTVFTVQLSDSANGTYTFKLLDNLDHASGDGKNDIALTFGFTATDSDGDTTAPASFTVHVTDDVPVAGVGDTRGVDEDDLLSGTSPNIFDLQVTGKLNVDWNSDDHDGGNANRSVSFEHTTAADNVVVRDASNNLVSLTSNGEAVHYAIVGGDLVAYTGNNSSFNRVFVVSLNDDNTGTYTFTLLGHIDHPTADGQNVLTFTFDYTATDSDGDKSSNVFSVTVKDDVPTIGYTESESVREDSLPTTSYDTTFPDAPNSTVQIGDLNINWGADNNNSGTTNNRSVVFTTAAGATGLTSDGTAIVYSISADGTVLTAKAGSRTVFTVELSDSGDGSYKFTLFDNIDHAASGPNDASMTLSFGIKATDSDGDAATASFAVTIVDDAPEAHTGDSRTINENDLSNGTSPNASGLTATGALHISWGSDDANPTSGGGLGDRAVGFRFTSAGDNVDAENSNGQNLTLRSDGQTVQYAFDGKTLVGYIGANLASGTRIFEVTLSDANDGSYTFKLLGNLDHPAGSGTNVVNLTFSYTATDGDGDTSSSEFTVTIRDDVPEIGSPVASSLTEDTTGAAGSETFVTQTASNKSLNIDWGADDNNSGTANRSVAFASSIDTGDSVRTTSSGNPVLKSNGVTVQFLRVSDTEIWGIANDNGGQLTLSDRKVFHITLSDTGNGTYTFELLDNIDHVGTGQTSALSLQIGFVATDADGDSDSSSFTVTINDDNGRPSIGTAEAVSVDEDGLSGGNTAPAVGDLPGAATSGTGSLAISWGADDNNSGSADRSVAFVGITNGQNASSNAGLLTVDGVQVKLWVVGDTVYGYTGNNPSNGSTPPSAGSQVFTVSLSDLGAGSYTFNLLKHLDHPAGNNENDISLSFGYRATDSDGDVTASSTFTVTVNDDSPVTTGAITASKTLDDEAQSLFPANTANVSGDVSPDVKTVSGAAGSLFSAGADGFKSVTMTSATFSVIYKDANGFALTETATWGSPVVGANGVTTWTATSTHYTSAAVLVINADGSYSVTVNAPVVHGTNSATEDNKSLTFDFTVTDADNDSATGSLTVNVNDDAPVSKGTVTAATTLDDEAQSLFPANTANVSGDVSPDVKTVSGAAGSLFTAGADGLKSVAMTSATFSVIYKDANGFALTETATWGSPVVGANGVTTWTATSTHYTSAAVLVINADGSYSVTVNAPVVHATNSATEENKALTFNITVTDGDGDTATGSLTVNVNDDAPVSKGVVTAATTLDDEAQSLFPANTANVSGDVSPDVKTVSGAAGSLFTAGADGVKSVAMTSATFGVIYKDANGFALTETATWGSPVVGANGVTTWTATSAHYGSAAVLVINADGSYSVTVNAPIVHSTNSATEDNKALTFNVTVTDGDGDTATGSLTVNVNDDTVVLGAAVAGFVDEGNLSGGNKNDGYPGDLTTAQGDNGTRTTSGSLAIAFGADGKAATVTGGTSTQTFTFSGNSTLTADLIVTQGTVNHPSASGIVYGGINNPIIINANDGLPFKLDALDLGLSGAPTTPTVILKGYDSNNNLVATYTLSVANVASLVSGTPTHFDATGTPFANVLIDRLEIYTGVGFSGYVMADNLVVTQNTASGPVVVDAAVTFTDHSNGLANIVVKDANGNDVTATLTSKGAAVHYAMIDAVTLIGYTGATAPTSLGDARVVFSAVLSSASANGAYTFTQNAALDHPIAGQDDDLTFTFNFTAKDGDGDTANGHFTVTVDDDAPVATAAVLTGAVYENELSTATGDLSTGTQAGNADNKNGDAGTDDSILVGNLSSLVSMGADSPGSFVVEATNLSTSLTSLTSGGVALTYTVVGNTLIAWAGTNQIFTFAVDATTGAYTFTLKGQIDHVANYVIDNASIPVAAIDQPGEIYAVAAINGNPRAFEGRLPDGDVIISVTNSGNTAVNWVLHNTDGGTDYPLSIAANTTIFINVGQISTPPNVHFELTGAGAPNGQTTVNSGHQDIVATGGSDALALDLSSAVTVRDGDGDTLALHDQLTVTITDDAPVIVSPAVVGTVDETNTPLVQVAYGSLKVAIGADKVGAHMDFATYGNGTPQHPASLSSDGAGLNYVLRTTEYGEKQLVAFKFGDTVDNPVFIVALSSPSNPTYIFTLFQNLDHAPNSNTMDLAFTIRVTDGDGDYVDQTIHVNVTDSIPTIPVTTVQRADVQDDALVNGIPEAGDTATASGTLSFNYGADSNGHLSWVGATLPNGGFTSVVNGNVFEIYQLQNSVNVKVFTVTLNPTTGEYLVEQFAAVHHPDGGGELGETFNLTYRVTDGDGDYVDGSLSVVVGDDVPVIIGSATQANLLSNGDFSGGSAWHDASYGAWATEATGWKISGTVPGQTGVQLERVPSGYFGVVTSNGEPMVDLGASPGNIAISQTLNGLTVGQHYTLSFEIGTYDPASSGLQVYWNGQLVGTYAPGSTMAIQTLDLIAGSGANTVTFKEVGNASDNTGTYLANVSLVQAASTSLPLFHADIGEDGSSVVSLVSGTNYRFGADGPGSVAFDTAHATISTPTGTTLGVPSITYDPVTGKVTVNPGWGFNGLSEGEVATLSVPFTVTDSDGDTKTGIYQFTIHGTNDAVGTSEGFPDAGTMTEYAETDPRAGSSTDRVEFDAPPGYGGLNGGGFWIYDDQGDTHTLTVTPQATGYLGHLTAVVSEETVNDGVGFVNWQYHVTDADLNPLAQGETKVEKFTITVDDGHGSTTSREITVTLVGTNDSPVITTTSASAVVFEAGGLNNVVTADVAVDHKFEPIRNVDSVADDAIGAGINTAADMKAVVLAVQSALGAGATMADAIAAVWDYLDDARGLIPNVDAAYYAQSINKATVLLGLVYGEYLQEGGRPLLDVVVKYQPDGGLSYINGGVLDGTPDRVQSLHDNLLGAVDTPSIDDKFSSNQVLLADLKAQILAAGLTDRPIYSGEEGGANNALAWDQAHGFLPVAAGQLAATDVDHGAVLTWSGTTTTAFGTFTISTSGAWSYTLNQSGEADKLAEGETKVETFTATVTDEHGAIDTIPVTITIKGTNDAPVITSAASEAQGTVTEAGDPSAINGPDHISGQLAAADVDHGATQAWTITGPATYGTMVIDAATGKWTYTLDNTLTATQHLNEGDSVTQTFTATVTDDHGATDTVQVTVTINGTNDAAVISGTTSGAATEAMIFTAGTSASGDLNSTDIDNPADAWTVVATATATASGYGNYTIDATGHWTYTVNNANTTVDGLKAGEHLSDTFTVTTVDGTPQTVTVTITGVNDYPVANDDGQYVVGEDVVTVFQASQLLANDTDAEHDTLTVDMVFDTASGATATLNADGTISYDPRGVTILQQLAADQTMTDFFSYRVNDGHGGISVATVYIVVQGANDAPVVAVVTGTATEGGPASALDALANASDIDNGAILSVTGIPANLPAGVTYNASTHKFTLDPTNAAYDYLAPGQTTTVTVNYGVTDGTATTPGSVSWTLTGTNDAPVLSGMGNTATYTENGPAVMIDSTITLSDVDDTNIEGATVKISGNFAAGQDVLSFTNQNGITGIWDATTGTLTLNGSATKAQYEAALESITYKNTSEDPSTAARTISFTVTDGDLTSNVGTGTVNVIAVNDAPVIVGHTSGAGAGEDAAMYPPVKYIGNMAVSDPDGGPPVGQLVGTAISLSSGSLTPAQQDAITAALITGKFAFTDVTTDTNGNKVVNWELTAPGAINLDFLAAGQNLTVTFNMAVSDGMATSNTVSYNIVFTGTNDAPVLTGDHAATMAEGGTYTIVAADLGFSDPDDVASGVTFTASSLSHGTIQVNGVTATTFSATQLAAGQVTFVHDGSEGTSAGFQINVEDGNEDNSTPVNQAFTITVTPVNDGAAPVSITDTTQTATAPKEGDVLQANLGTDPDGAKSNIVYHWQNDGHDIAGATGSTYTLTADDVGHKISVNVTYSDGQNFNESVTSAQTDTVLRTNHAPVAQNDSNWISIAEDNGTFFPANIVLGNDYDPDGDQLTIVSVQDVTSGSVTFSASGFVFTPTPNYFGPVSFSYTVADPDGLTSTATVSFNVYNVNDPPDLDLDTTTAGYTSTVVASPNGVPVKLTSANVSVSDIDDTTIHHVYLQIVNAQAGDLLGVSGLPAGYVVSVSDPNGTWLDIRKSDGTAGTFAEYEAVLEAVTFSTTSSSTEQRNVSVMIADPHGGSTWSNAFVTINALPVGSTDNYTVAEDGTLSVPAVSGVLANDTDAEGASLTAAVVTGPAHGTLTLNADGSFTYTPAANYAGADSFTYKANDGLADSTPVTVNLTVTAVNDGAATIAVTDTTQTATAPKVGDVLQANLGADPDGAKSNIVYHWQSDGQNIVGATGATYTLTAGDIGHKISVNVTYTDGQNFNESVTSAQTAVVITDNHAPVANDDTGSATEKGGVNNGSGGINATGNVITNDSDVDNNTLSISAVRTGTEAAGTGTAGTVGQTLVGAHGTLTLNSNGSYTYVVNDGDTQVQALSVGDKLTDTFTYTVKDNGTGNLTDTAQLVITINGSNDAPVLTGDLAATVAEGGSYTIVAADLGFSDPDDVASGVTFTASSLSHGTIQVNGVTATTFTGTQLANGQVSFVHDGSEGSAAGFQINVEDGNEDNSTPVNQAFTFTVSPVNDGAATIAVTDTTQTATAPKVGDVLQANLGTDPDGAKSNIVYHWQSDGQNISGATNSTYTLTANDVGHKISVNVTYTDGQNFNENVTSTQTAAVITDNHAPVAVNDTYVGVTGTAPTGAGWVYNSDNGHYYKAVYGNYSFAQSVTAAAAEAPGAYLVTITGAAENSFVQNLVPLYYQYSWIGASDQAVEGTWRWVTGPEAGQLVTYTNWNTWEPNNWNGNEDYALLTRIFGGGWNDADGSAATPGDVSDYAGYVAEWGGVVTGVPTEDTAVVISAATLLANDSDQDAGDTISITSVQGATHGTVSLSADHQTITFTPEANYNGAASFTYTITDSHGATSTATVSFNIGAVNDAPVAAADAIITNASSVTIPTWALLANDSDADGDTLSITASSAGTLGSGSISGVSSGSSFTYTVSDGSATGTGNATVTQDAVGALDGNESANILVAVDTPVAQKSTITFASSYDQGDKVSITVDGVTYNYTVASGGQTAEQVYDALKAVSVGGVTLANSLSTKGVTWASDLTSNAVTLTSTAGASNAFTVTAAVDNSADVGKPWVASVNFAEPGNWGPSSSIAITINGVEYKVNSSSGVTFANAENSLVTVLVNAGFSASYVASTDVFTVSSSTAITSASGSLKHGSTTDAVTGSITAGALPTDQTITVSNTQVASNGGSVMNGYGGADVLVGGDGNDTLNGGAGNDTLYGGAGADTFKLSTISGTDTIKDFTVGTDKIALLDNGDGNNGSVNFANTTGGNALNASDFLSVANSAAVANIDNRVIVFQTAVTDAQISSLTMSQAQSDYVVIYNSTQGRAEIWFDADWADATGRTLVTVLQGVTLAQVSGLTAASFSAYSSATDPIVLDLDHNGFSFVAVQNGVSFDINADGAKDQVAWTSTDGILAYDLNGDGKINNGSEIFTTSFNGGHFASGVAALASLDSNHDGKIDASDAAFSKLSVWVDANHNGVTDAGELVSLTSLGIAGINLDATANTGTIDGQSVASNGSFTYADGSKGAFVEVNLDTTLGDVTHNSGDMVLADGSLTTFSGALDNTGTISGAGQLGDDQLTLINEGTIVADGSNALVIDTGDNAVINTGTLEATGDGGLDVRSDVVNDGVLWANGGNIDLEGNVSGTGSALLSGHATLEIGGAFNEQITFDDTAEGTLVIDDSADFHGMLSGFDGNDTIDLTDILGSAATATYTENAQGTGGVLTVTDGSHTANIAFSGQYTSEDFHLGADSSNHALVQLEQHVQQLNNAA